MKKIGLTLVLLVALTSLSYADDISVDSITVDPPTSGGCTYTWTATIRNNGSGPITSPVSMQGVQYVGSNGYGAGGTSVSSLAAGATATRSLGFTRKPGATDFAIVLRQGGQQINKDQVALPAEPAPNLSIDSIDIRDNGYTIVVRNNNAMPVSEVTVQAYMATAQAPNSWTPIGGGALPCIGANSTSPRNSNRSSGWNSGYSRYKVLLRHGTTTLHEEIFDLGLTQPSQQPQQESSGDNLSVESLTVDPPTTGCQYRWYATIRNNGTAPLSASVSVQGTQYVGSQGHGAGGTSVSSLAPGQATDKNMGFTRKPGATDFAVIIRQGTQQIAKSQITLPAEPAANLSIDSADFRNNGYTIVVRNNNSMPVSEVTVQAYMATAQAPNSWTPIGGGTIPCIGANSTSQRNTNRSSGWNSGYSRYKVLLKHGMTVLHQQIFDLGPTQQPSMQSSGEKDDKEDTGSTLQKRRLTPKRIRPTRR